LPLIDFRNATISLRWPASAMPVNGFILLPPTTSSGLAMNLSRLASSQVMPEFCIEGE